MRQIHTDRDTDTQRHANTHTQLIRDTEGKLVSIQITSQKLLIYTNFGNRNVRETIHTRRLTDVHLREPGHLATFIQNETIAIIVRKRDGVEGSFVFIVKYELC